MTMFVDVGDSLIHVDHIRRLRQTSGPYGPIFVVETTDGGTKDVSASLYWKVKRAGMSVTLPAGGEFIAAGFTLEEGVGLEVQVVGWHVDSDGHPWPIVPGIDSLDMAPYEALLVRDARTASTSFFTAHGRRNKKPLSWDQAIEDTRRSLEEQKKQQ